MGQPKTSGGVNAKGRNRRRGKFVRLGHAMVNSPAFQSLKGPALKYYIALRDRFNGMNNGTLHLSCDVASKTLHMSKGTVLNAQQELQEKGFIRMTQRGGFRQRLATTWALTDERCSTGAGATNDWKNWKP